MFITHYSGPGLSLWNKKTQGQGRRARDHGQRDAGVGLEEGRSVRFGLPTEISLRNNRNHISGVVHIAIE